MDGESKHFRKITTKNMNWTNQLIRCSSLGCLFTEPQAKADKDAGNLSKTAKTHLKSVYIQAKYGRKREILTPAMRKGIECEQDSINLLSRYHKKVFAKNLERFSNEYVTGHPDILDDDHVIDIKTCESIWTFHDNIGEPLDKMYIAQLQGYLWLTGKQSADISYCLTSANEQMLNDEKLYRLRKMNVISEESIEFIEECKKIELNMTYEDLPISERILIFKVPRDEEFISQIPSKVEKAREYLEQYDNIFKSINQ